MKLFGFSLGKMPAAVMMMAAFALPTFANFQPPTGTFTCTTYSLHFKGDVDQGQPGAQANWTIHWTFTLHPDDGIGPNITTSGIEPIPHTGNGFQAFDITVNGSLGPLQKNYSILGTPTAQLFVSVSPNPESPDVSADITFTANQVQCNVPPPPPPTSCTYTQGGWGSRPRGNNPGMFLLNNFPGNVVIGGGSTLTFNSAVSIQNFLPQGGTPGKLTDSASNPLSTSAGVFAGQVLALKLNVTFYSVGSLVLTGTGTSMDGKTVNQILAAANIALGGGALPAGFTYSTLNDLVDKINNGFDNCSRNSWATAHLVSPV